MITNILQSDYCVFSAPEYFVLALDEYEIGVSFRRLVWWAASNRVDARTLTEFTDAEKRAAAEKHAGEILECVAGDISDKTYKAAKKDLADFCLGLLNK